MPQYGCYVKFTAQSSKRDALVELLLKAAEQVTPIAECELYVINTSPDEPEAVWVTEIWNSQADSEAALKVEGAKENIQQVLALLADKPQRTVVQPVGGKGLS